MVLGKYKSKRKFAKTPEPKGVKRPDRGKDLRFVVQKHQASHLHYDLRLEVDGVLKSWAVPKGPSLNPQDKHLAVMVEDHPLDYQDFEGVIPPDNYGAGTVMIWDSGMYHPIVSTPDSDDEELIKKGLTAGHLTILLEGQKLKGEFALIKLKRAEDNAWLLIKAGDAYASDSDILVKDRSASSGRTMDEIAADSLKKTDYWTENHVDPQQLNAVHTDIPMPIKPMLATLIERPFDDDKWIFEIKWDGFRAITYIEQGKTDILSRNNRPLNARFPEIAESFEGFPYNAVFDGEIVVIDDKGRPDFQELQDYTINPSGTLVYYIFDILYLDGYSLLKTPLTKRKDLLAGLVKDRERLHVSEYLDARGIDFMKVAVKQGLEGIIAKRADSVYAPGKRSKDWLKIKNVLRQETVIVGFTGSDVAQRPFGSLILAVYDNNELVYAGHAGSGFNEQALSSIHSELVRLKQKNSPLKDQPALDDDITWVKPKLVCEVKFQEWTDSGIMRQAIFLGLRDDKKPEEAIRENPIAVERVLKT